MNDNHFDPNQPRAKDGKWAKIDALNISKTAKDNMIKNIIEEEKNAGVNVKTTVDFLIILDKAQISYNYHKSLIYGSEYFVIEGKKYRLSDHPKKSLQDLGGATDTRSPKELYQIVSSKINLSDKTEIEKTFRKKATAKVTVRADGLLKTEDGRLFDDMEYATSYLWRKHLRPIDHYKD